MKKHCGQKNWRLVMPVKFWHTSLRFWFFLSYLITTVKLRGDFWTLSHILTSVTMGRFIYILDSSNSSSITFWTSQFSSSSRCKWCWNDVWTVTKQCHLVDKFCIFINLLILRQIYFCKIFQLYNLLISNS